MENTRSLRQPAGSITDPEQQAKVMQLLDELLLPVPVGVPASCEGLVDIAIHVRERPNSCADWHGSRTDFAPRNHSAVFRALDSREFGMMFPGGLAGRVEGTTVPLDAMGCRREIAARNRERGAD